MEKTQQIKLILQQFANKIRLRRYELNLTQEELVEKANFHVNYIGGIKRANRNPFLESIIFLARALDISPKDLMPDFETFEWKLIKNPQEGDVIPGLLGLRKTRLKAMNKGKSGGFRVDYLDIPEKRKLYFIVLYPKNVKEDLSPEEKKLIARVVKQLKEEANHG